MKKVFQLTDKKKHPDRVLEAIKHDIRKYIKREKGKKLADKELTYWDFDCKVGTDEGSAKKVTPIQLIKSLDDIKESGAESCYVEILAKVSVKPLKEEAPTSTTETETEEEKK